MKFGFLFSLVVAILVATTLYWYRDDSNKVFYFANKLSAEVIPPQHHILETVVSFVRSQALIVVTQLKVPDALGLHEAKSTLELSKIVNADAYSLCRVMRALASQGYFELITSDQMGCTFKNNKLSAFLMESHPESMRDLVLSMDFYPSKVHWDQLRDRTEGKPAPSYSVFWNSLEKDDEKREIFARSMEGKSIGSVGLLRSTNFEQYGVIADMGGGIGGVLGPLLEVYPNLHGVLFDLPNVVQNAQKRFQERYPNVLSRVKFVEGSFFETGTIPNATSYLFHHVLHGWTDDSVVKILTSLKSAMKRYGGEKRLLIFESISDSKYAMPVATAYDLMFMIVGGEERTLQKWTQVLQTAGFEVTSRTCFWHGNLLEAKPSQ